MKRLFLLIIMGVMLFGCSQGDGDKEQPNDNEENNTAEAEEENNDEDNVDIEETSTGDMSSENNEGDVERQGHLDEEDISKVYTDPLKYEGYEMTFDAVVFTDPERDSDGVYLQVFADAENYEKNTIVAVEDPDFDVALDDYVHVEGVIVDEFEGANALGGTVQAPVVYADKIEVVDYIDVMSPALETIDVDETIDQHGYEMAVDKVEVAENMTRVYMTVTNHTDETIYFYSFDSKLLMDNKQLEEDMGFYEADFPEMQSDILPGVESEGIITFPPLDSDTNSMTFHAEGSSDNYDLNFEPFVFEIEK